MRLDAIFEHYIWTLYLDAILVVYRVGFVHVRVGVLIAGIGGGEERKKKGFTTIQVCFWGVFFS